MPNRTIFELLKVDGCSRKYHSRRIKRLPPLSENKGSTSPPLAPCPCCFVIGLISDYHRNICNLACGHHYVSWQPCTANLNSFPLNTRILKLNSGWRTICFHKLHSQNFKTIFLRKNCPEKLR